MIVVRDCAGSTQKCSLETYGMKQTRILKSAHVEQLATAELASKPATTVDNTLCPVLQLHPSVLRMLNPAYSRVKELR